MALTSADFYWVDIFKSIQEQTDHEIESLNQLGPDARTVFASSLVESQRTSADLVRHFKHRKQNDVVSILQHQSYSELFHSTIVNELNLQTDPILRIFAKNALLYLDTVEDGKDDQVKLFRDGLDLHDVQDKLNVQLNCLLKYIRDVFEEKERNDSTETKTMLDKTSPEKFQLEDVPRSELQKRLNRGEIAPRDEWIPSEDKKNKKLITSMELRARLNFGERLMSEAKTAMDKDDFESASTLYTQGVHLLDQYKCDATADACDLAEWLNKFRRNNAIANLKLGRCRQAITSCTDALEDDEHDGKAKFLRAKAYMAVGDLKSAEEDLESLMSDGFATDAQRKAGQEGLRQLRIEAKRDRLKVASLFQGVANETCFSAGREVDHVPDPTDTPSLPPAWSSNSPSKRNDRPLPMEPQKYIKLLESMLRAYTFPEVADRLEALRHKVDYNERKIILRLQTVLPEILMPILNEFDILPSSEDYHLKKKELDRIIGVFQTSTQVADADRTTARILLKAIREALVGGEEVTD